MGGAEVGVAAVEVRDRVDRHGPCEQLRVLAEQEQRLLAAHAGVQAPRWRVRPFREYPCLCASQLAATPEETTARVREMVTDPARVKRTDPGEPEKCPVWQLHLVYSDDKTREWVQWGCRNAGIGCLECKQPVIEAVNRELAPILAAHPGETGALLLADGLDAFAARAMSARRAGRSLDLQYYIWNDDLAGQLLAREAHAAAERGVRVRILLDDLTAEGLDPKWMALDAHPAIELRLYNPFRNRASGLERGIELVQRAFSINYRMHNKAWIADGRVAVIGGRNIGEEYFNADAEVNFRDLDLLLFGPAVGQASSIFDEYWNSAAAVPIVALNRKRPEKLQAMLDSVDLEAHQAEAQPYLQRVAESQSVRAYQQRALEPHWSSNVQVVSVRPAYGTGYESTLFSFIDRDTGAPDGRTRGGRDGRAGERAGVGRGSLPRVQAVRHLSL